MDVVLGALIVGFVLLVLWCVGALVLGLLLAVGVGVALAVGFALLFAGLSLLAPLAIAVAFVCIAFRVLTYPLRAAH